MKKKGKAMRILCLVSAMIVGLTMTGMGVYATEGIDVQTEDLGTQNVRELQMNYTVSGNKYNVNLSWDTEDAADTYKVFANTEQTVTVSGDTTKTCSLSLDKGHYYDIYVVKQVESNPTSNHKYLLATKPVAEYDGSVITVSWDSIPEANQGYKVRTIKNGQRAGTAADESTTTYEFPNPEKGAKYAFELSLTGQGDATQTSNEVVIATQVKNVRAIAGYRGATVTWGAVQGANAYNVYRNGAKVATVNGTSAFIGGLGEGQACNYVVKAVFGDVEGEASNTASATSVRPLYVHFSVKTKKSLKAHDGSGARITVYKNQRFAAHGFGQGKYHFYVNGHLFYINRTGTKKAACDYTPYMDYTPEEATNIVNTSGLGSRTGYLLWASGYTQRLYIFTGSAGNWHYLTGWNISTGKASAPSPTGVKAISKKVKKRHGLKFWSCYSSMNAFHGVNAKSWKRKLGSPQSGGCIRNLTEQAQWIYYNIPKGTTVWSY